MERTSTSTKPDISSLAFWDVDFEKINFQKNSLFVMEKVLNYAPWDDIIKLIKYYGEDRIRKEIVNSTYLSKEVLNFVCFYFRLSPDDFICCNTRRSQNPLWHY